MLKVIVPAVAVTLLVLFLLYVVRLLIPRISQANVLTVPILREVRLYLSDLGKVAFLNSDKNAMDTLNLLNKYKKFTVKDAKDIFGKSVEVPATQFTFTGSSKLDDNYTLVNFTPAKALPKNSTVTFSITSPPMTPPPMRPPPMTPPTVPIPGPTYGGPQAQMIYMQPPGQGFYDSPKGYMPPQVPVPPVTPPTVRPPPMTPPTVRPPPMTPPTVMPPPMTPPTVMPPSVPIPGQTYGSPQAQMIYTQPPGQGFYDSPKGYMPPQVLPVQVPKTGQTYGAPAPYDKSSSDADVMSVYQGKNKELELEMMREMAANPSGALRGLMKQRDYLNAEKAAAQMPMYGAIDGEVAQMLMPVYAEPTEKDKQLEMMIADQVAKDKKEIMSKIPGYRL